MSHGFEKTVYKNLKCCARTELNKAGGRANQSASRVITHFGCKYFSRRQLPFFSLLWIWWSASSECIKWNELAAGLQPRFFYWGPIMYQWGPVRGWTGIFASQCQMTNRFYPQMRGPTFVSLLQHHWVPRRLEIRTIHMAEEQDRHLRWGNGLTRETLPAYMRQTLGIKLD